MYIFNDKEDIAWAAGLFDGEGSIFVANVKQGKYKYARLSVVSTDYDLVERFHNIVGFGRIYDKVVKKGNKKAWVWQVQGFELAQFVICLMWKHLGVRRKQQWKTVSGCAGIR